MKKHEERPESEEQFKRLLEVDRTNFNHCFQCKQPFTSENVYSDMGWRETQISGICEKCFDKMFEESEDHEDEQRDPPF